MNNSLEQISQETLLTEAEAAHGLIIQRRRLLWLPILAASALLARPTSLVAQTSMAAQTTAPAAENKNSQLDWETFVKDAAPTAKELHKDSSPQGQDAYLYYLAAYAARLRLNTIPRAALGKFGELNPPVHFGVGYRGAPFFAVEWWLEPNAVLPPHCHPNASVCTLCFDGETRIRNFEFVGPRLAFDWKNTFQVRETHNEILNVGRINTLSATRDNIHAFQAGKQGARGIDFSAYHGPDVGFSFLQIEEKPKDAEQRIFEAVWRKL